MNELSPALLTTTFLILIVIFLYVLLASFVVDLKALKLQKSITNITSKKRPRFKKIALIIYVHNRASEITQCLATIKTARTSATEIIIIDNASYDGTSQKVRSFQKLHPKFKAAVIFKRVSGSKLSTVKQAVRKIKKSDAVLVVDAGTIVSKDLLLGVRALAAFPEGDEEPVVLPSIGKIHPNYLLLARSYFELSKHLVKKSLVLVGASYSAEGNGPILYRTLQSAKKGDRPKYKKESYLFAATTDLPRISSFSLKSLGFLFSILSLIAYIIYLAVSKEVLEPLLYSFLLVVLWLSVLIVSAPALTKREKFLAFSSIPLAYPLLFVTGWLEVFNSTVSKKYTHHKSFYLARRL